MDHGVNVRLLNLDQIRNGLKDKKLHMLSKLIGLSYPTLQKLRDDKDNNPTYETLVAVSSYLINTSSLKR